MGRFGPGDVRLFDRLAGVYDATLPAARKAPLEAGLRFADRPVERLVDVAGGTGRAGAQLADERAVIVCDASAGMLSRATGLDAVRGDARRLPFASGAVDAAIIVDALHHVPDPATVLADCVRVVAPGGVVVVREFDPRTLLGGGLAAGEHLIGMDSTFLTPDAVVDALTEAGGRGYLVDPGWSYTVVGVNPRETDGNPDD